ncbi:MAG: ATP-binding protein, partial [Chloroflexota bacterium]
ILGIFPPGTPLSYLEHLLLTLNVPPDLLSKGSATVGATADVLTAYRVIDEAGGLAIAAHANSGNGVVMRGLDFGGQTRIAYTQDPHLHALEVTDLEKRGQYTTRRFFDGSKPEYPRAMRCIQGSDAHRLTRETPNSKNLGVGDRVTEILLEEVSFAALAAVIKSNDFSLTRPFRGRETPLDFVQAAREEGATIVQSFHASLLQRGGHLDRVLEDICAMANTNGGTIYVGVSANPKEKPLGVRDPHKAVEGLQAAITSRFSPAPDVEIDTLLSQGQSVVRITVPPGRDLPHAIDQNKFYVRDETETNLAVRDEIVRLVERGWQNRPAAPSAVTEQLPEPAAIRPPQPVEPARTTSAAAPTPPTFEPPRTGVEVVRSEERQGTIYHTVRDLRNGSLIKNVTRASARRLWHYAITQVEAGTPDAADIPWRGNVALLRARRKDDRVWYDLALRENSEVHIYYGVTDSGLNEKWLELIAQSGELDV